jgi:hypothetical protein
VIVSRPVTVVVLALSGLLLAGATTPGPTVEELTARADVVVRVRVAGSAARWLASNNTERIVSFHDTRVVDVIAGALSADERRGDAVLVGTLGGAVGDIEQRVSGAARLEMGQEYLLFLGPADGPDSARRVVVGWRGALLVSAQPTQAAALADVTARVRAVNARPAVLP